MAYVDFILNLAGLLLWLNWRSIQFDPLAKRKPATLMGTLRPAAPKKLRRWQWLALVVGLLFLRAVAYRWIAPLWVGTLHLAVTAPQFLSNAFSRMLCFSFLSFGLSLGIFFTGLLFLSLLKGPEPIHRMVNIPLGRVDGWPRGVKIFLPLLAAALGWFLLSWPLGWRQHLPVSLPLCLEQSLVIGLASYLVWKFPAGALLALHLLNSYIYFGKHPFWNYINGTAQTMLRPLKKYPLRAGKVDLAPVLAIALIFFAAEGAERGLAFLYAHLPF